MGLACADAQILLVERGALWDYLDDGSNQGSSAIVAGAAGYTTSHWKHPDYVPGAGWGSGVAPLGYGDPPPVTQVGWGPNATSRYITTYFRHEFNVTAAQVTQINTLSLNIQRDDGAMIYLNGKELHRENMPAGTISYTTTSAAVVGGADETTLFQYDLPAGGFLQAGKNVLAVEIHQQSASSSDIIFDLDLTGSNEPPKFGLVAAPISTDLERATPSEYRHRRLEGDEPPIDLEYLTSDLLADSNGVDTYIGFTFAGDFDDWVDLEGKQISFGYLRNNVGWVETETIDISSHDEVQISVDVRTFLTRFDNFDANDFLRLKALFTTDGANIQERTFFDRSGAGASALQYTDLAGEDAPKKVFVAEDAGQQLPAGWVDVGYDDSGWGPTFTLGAGFDTGSDFDPFIGSDLFSQMYFTTPSVFMRVPFTFDEDPADMEIVELGVRYDDGYVAYLNGVEIARENAAGVTGAWNDKATTQHPDAAAVVYQYINITAHKNLLVQGGPNMLAVHGLNFEDTSSDMLILPIIRYGVLAPPDGTLDELNTGPNGPMTTFTSPVGLIPNTAATVKLRIECQVGDPGENVALVDFTDEEIHVDNFVIGGVPQVADSFENWLFFTTLTGEDAAYDADADGDGLTTLMEYSLGTDPEVADNVPGIPPHFQVDASGFLNVQHRAIQAPFKLEEGFNSVDPNYGIIVRDIRYIVQQSDDLRRFSWSDGRIGEEFLKDGIIDDVPSADELTRTLTLKGRNMIDYEVRHLNHWRLRIEKVVPPSSFSN